MKSIEREMLRILKRGREEFGFVAVKAEFEAEGTRPDEFLRLLELARKADLKVALKIGGAEAVSDLLSSQMYGVDYIIAPMVETPYALSKYVDAVGKVYKLDEREDTEFLFNLETQTTLENITAMAEAARAARVGMVFGRVDFTLSRGMPRKAVNERSITEAVLEAARVCRGSDLPLVVGGSVAAESIDALREVRAVRLDRLETRKIVFDGAAIEADAIRQGIELAGLFELDWLKSKQDYYGAIAREDASRLEMLTARFA